MKTNKSFAKRVRVTKRGKVLAGRRGGNHFNAKESRQKQLKRHRAKKLTLGTHTTRRFLPRTNV